MDKLHGEILIRIRNLSAFVSKFCRHVASSCEYFRFICRQTARKTLIRTRNLCILYKNWQEIASSSESVLLFENKLHGKILIRIRNLSAFVSKFCRQIASSDEYFFHFKTNCEKNTHQDSHFVYFC